MELNRATNNESKSPLLSWVSNLMIASLVSPSFLSNETKSPWSPSSIMTWSSTLKNLNEPEFKMCKSWMQVYMVWENSSLKIVCLKWSWTLNRFEALDAQIVSIDSKRRSHLCYHPCTPLTIVLNILYTRPSDLLMNLNSGWPSILTNILICYSIIWSLILDTIPPHSNCTIIDCQR